MSPCNLILGRLVNAHLTYIYGSTLVLELTRFSLGLEQTIPTNKSPTERYNESKVLLGQSYPAQAEVASFTPNTGRLPTAFLDVSTS